MSKSNKGKGRQHINKLIPCRPGLVFLCDAVQYRFITILSDHLRVTGEPLLPSPDYDADMVLWRTLSMRLKAGDHRFTLDEKKATRRIAQWTMDEKSKLTGTPRKIIQWAD